MNSTSFARPRSPSAVNLSAGRARSSSVEAFRSCRAVYRTWSAVAFIAAQRPAPASSSKTPRPARMTSFLRFTFRSSTPPGTALVIAESYPVDEWPGKSNWPRQAELFMQVPCGERFLPRGRDIATREGTHDVGEPGKAGKPGARAPVRRGSWGKHPRLATAAPRHPRPAIDRSHAARAPEPARCREPRVPRCGRQVHGQGDRLDRARGDEVVCTVAVYEWLYEHPDRVALAWQRLKVPSIPINDLGNGKFGWTDEYGSEVVWQTVGTFTDGRIWYATGKVKAAPATPSIPVQSVVVVRHKKRIEKDGVALYCRSWKPTCTAIARPRTWCCACSAPPCRTSPNRPPASCSISSGESPLTCKNTPTGPTSSWPLPGQNSRGSNIDLIPGCTLYYFVYRGSYAAGIRRVRTISCSRLAAVRSR